MKKVHIKSAVPIYISAVVWLVVGIIKPVLLLKISTLLIVVIISAIAGLISKRFFPGRTVEVQEEIKTGDQMLDVEIKAGRARLERLRSINVAIEQQDISSALDRMYVAGEQIFKELGRDKGKYSLVRRFMNYYLPTTEKLMEQYLQLSNARIKGENVVATMHRIEDSLGVISNAFEKCLDNLYADQELDVDAEIDVMRTMLRSDGLIDIGVNPVNNAVSDNEQGISLTLGSK